MHGQSLASEGANSIAHAGLSVHAKGLAISMNGYLSKPVKPAALAVMIAQVWGSVDQLSTMLGKKLP
jgi:CheY-like chemotaxis protein